MPRSKLTKFKCAVCGKDPRKNSDDELPYIPVIVEGVAGFKSNIICKRCLSDKESFESFFGPIRKSEVVVTGRRSNNL